jgi:hypothetical protein
VGHIAVRTQSLNVCSSDAPHPGSHTVRGFAQAPVSSMNLSSVRTRLGWLKSWERFRGRPLAVKCLRRAAVCIGQSSNTCSIVWTGSPQGQATCSRVCCGKKRCVYEPVNACPVMTRYSVQRVKRENLTASCLARNVGCSLPSGGLVSAILYAREERGA